MDRTLLFLVRHGETAANATGVFQGQRGHGLNEVGRAQARALATRLEGRRFHAFYTSDLERARETASFVAATIDQRPVEDARLREVDVGGWSEKTADEIAAAFPDEWAAWRKGEDIRRGGGETYAELATRLTLALDDIAARHVGQTVLVVSHGAAIKCTVARLLGIEGAAFRTLGALTNTSVTAVAWDAELGKDLLVWNDTAHLGDPVAGLLRLYSGGSGAPEK